jgi:mono/diheme cytochrome c family protein
MRALLPKLVLLTLAAALAATCNSLPDVPSGASGPEMYRLLRCADCHGPTGAGSEKGPPLRELRLHWAEERQLADYLRDPTPFQRGDARIRWMWDRYSWDMPGYRQLSIEQRMRLAAWLFTLG